MFIIPVLTISNNGGTIYDLIMSNNFNIAKLLGELFIPTGGEFFILLLVQQGVASAVWYSLNCSDIIWSYFTPSLAFEKRKIFNDQAPWRRDEQTTFLYGYFNSQIMTIFTICIFYAPTVPLVPAAAWFFVYMRHTVDGYNLLTYFRREIDSSGKMIDYTTNTALTVVIMYQICMTAYFAIHNRRAETIACTIIFLLSIFYAAVTYEDVYDLAKIEESMETIGNFDETAFTKWKNEYAHPLVVGHSRRREVSQIRRVHEVNSASEVGNMGVQDPRQDGLGNAENRVRNTRLFELTEQQN